MREKPRTKAGQVRQAWPDIKDLFAAGHSLKDIWIWLNEIGIAIGYARLSDYTRQLKRRDQTAAPPHGEGTVVDLAGTRTGIPVGVRQRDAEKRMEPVASKEPADADPRGRTRRNRHFGWLR